MKNFHIKAYEKCVSLKLTANKANRDGCVEELNQSCHVCDVCSNELVV